MFAGHSVSVVMPAFNEAAGIHSVVTGFLALPEVDEVVVADNCSSDNTALLAAQAGARVVSEPRPGYGNACRAALAAASGDYVILVESDATFSPLDVRKFLAYSDDFDVIFGTRTSKTCIWSGANMGHFLRYGNWAVAKFLEYLHNGPCLTDVGCTYKFLKREPLLYLLSIFDVGDSRFSPELMLASIRSGFRCVEIPVNYGTRLGTSKITGSFRRAFTLGLRMILLIFARRFRSYPRQSTATEA